VNRWIAERRKKLIQEYGGKCRNCLATTSLHFAHVEETEISAITRGRGRKERVYDVIKNPDSYTLLCKDCHREFDR